MYNVNKVSYLLTLGFLLIRCSSISSQVTLPYSSGFNDSSEKLGWVEYKTESTQFSHWNYGTGYLSSTSIGHDYSPSSGVTLTDNWFVSPGFSINNGGNLDSIRYKFSGFSEPLIGDTVGIYLLRGSQDPLLATSKLLLFDFRGSEYITDGVYRRKENINLPANNEISYLAIRYRNTDCSSKWLTVSFDNVAINGNLSSIKDEVDDETKIYPNPATNVVNITTVKPISNLTISSIEGKVIYFNNEIEKGEAIDVSSFERGVYFFKYYIEGTTYSNKVIVE